MTHSGLLDALITPQEENVRLVALPEARDILRHLPGGPPWRPNVSVLLRSRRKSLRFSVGCSKDEKLLFQFYESGTACYIAFTIATLARQIRRSALRSW